MSKPIPSIRWAWLACMWVVAFPGLGAAIEVEGPKASGAVALPPAAAPAARSTIAVLEIGAEPAYQEKARGLSSIIAAQLARSPGTRLIGYDDVKNALGIERQRQLLGCKEESCLVAIGDLLQAGQVIHGRLDRYGKAYVLSISAFDTRKGEVLAKLSERATDEDGLLEAADHISAKLQEALGLSSSPEAARAVEAEVYEPAFSLNPRLGHALADLADNRFKLRGAMHLDLELDYYLRRYFSAFLEIGVVFGNVAPGVNTEPRPVTIVPAWLGAKYLFRADKRLRPYAGVGLGLKVLAQFFNPESRGDTSFSFGAVGGLAYYPWPRVGFNLEAKVDPKGLVVKSADSGANIDFVYNTDFGVLILF